MTSTSSTDSAMKIVEIPASNDVLCGKDKTFNRNIGNMTYRQMIVATAMRYAQFATKPEKMKITAHIVHTMIHIHHSRFLKQVMVHGSGGEYYWQEISITAARDKTSHALRFCASQLMHQHQHQHQHHQQHDENWMHSATKMELSTTLPTPITPPIRRSTYRRPHRSSAHNRRNVAVSIPSTKKKAHRRTVSSEIALPVLMAADRTNSDNNNNKTNRPITRTSNHQQNHTRNGTDEPIPMECKSSCSIVPYSSNTSYMNHSYSDDLDAILREPINWEDAVGDEDATDHEDNTGSMDDDDDDHVDGFLLL
jgi:hypothetical protein